MDVTWAAVRCRVVEYPPVEDEAARAAGIVMVHAESVSSPGGFKLQFRFNAADLPKLLPDFRVVIQGNAT